MPKKLRPPPFGLREKIEQKLEELVNHDIIEPVEGPTPWVNPVVIIPKPSGDIRLCVDMRRANQAIVRERHPIPTVDDVLYQLNGSTIFSKLNLNCPFEWGTEQQSAFDALKNSLANAETLAYFDSNAEETKLITDASPVGLGAVLTQVQGGCERVVAYASRSLTDVERRYSLTEKEALGLVWGCERFHVYLYGVEFTLLTDHKPLEVMYSTNSRNSARVERWVLRLQPYRFKVQYVPGKQNIADPLSRLGKGRGVCVNGDAEEFIRFVAEASTPADMSVWEVEEESWVDPEVSQLRQCITTGEWDNAPPQYKAVRNELSVLGKLVLRGPRLLIPEKLRDRVVDLAHEGHQGLTKTKQRLRSKVWWAGIDRQVEA